MSTFVLNLEDILFHMVAPLYSIVISDKVIFNDDLMILPILFGFNRCIYRAADVYLMDDPLSAVDSKVGNHIFEK